MEIAASGLMGVPQEGEFDAVGKFLRAREMAPLPRDAASGVLGRALVSLHGKDHRDRRAIENPLFSSDSLRRYEDEVLEPSIDHAIKGFQLVKIHVRDDGGDFKDGIGVLIQTRHFHVYPKNFLGHRSIDGLSVTGRRCHRLHAVA